MLVAPDDGRPGERISAKTKEKHLVHIYASLDIVAECESIVNWRKNSMKLDKQGGQRSVGRVTNNRHRDPSKNNPRFGVREKEGVLVHVFHTW